MFDIGKNNIVVPTPSILLIKEFKSVWNRDKTTKKERALNEFAYIYFKHDFKSIYKTSFTDEEIEVELRRDIFNKPKWKADKLVIAAENRYKVLQVTKSLAFLNAAEKALSEIKKYFNDFDLSKVDAKDKHTAAKNMLGNIKEVDEVTSKLFNTRKRVQLEQLNTSISKRKLGDREVPPDQR